MFDWFDKNQRWLRQGLKKSSGGLFRDYLLQGLPDVNQRVSDSRFFVLDFETTGLNVDKDHIISAGFTEIVNNRISLGSSEHHLVSTDFRLSSENVGIHHLTDDMVSQGMSVTALMQYLLKKMAGKVIIAHYQTIEFNFIQQVCMKLYGLKLPMIILDTLQIEKRKLERLNKPITSNQLRLFNLRKAYHLPRYNAHNAMEDAIATAELFLAQISKKQTINKPLRLKDLI